jgi:IS1 family transposase
MNKLPSAKQESVIAALVEGSSIRSVERMTGVHRDTITRLMIRVGGSCGEMMDATLRGLSCKHLQMDEIWCYVGKKQRHVLPEDDLSRVGDFWTYVALDTDTKLVPAHRVGKRDRRNTRAFVNDLASRLEGRVQLSSDMLEAYVFAVEDSFGFGGVDYGRIVKHYEAEPVGPGRYSPPHVTSTTIDAVLGSPRGACTSHVERQNLTMRMSMRRFTRLTNAFSKKVENLRAAVALHFAHYNFVRIHRSLRITPAMAAGVTSRVWDLGELVELGNRN